MTSIQSAHPLPGPPSHLQHQPFQPQYQQQYPQQYQQQYQRQYQQPQQPQQPPPPPHHQQQQQQEEQRTLPRTRSKSSFSFRSDKSHKSSGSVGKIDLTETAKEKASRRLSTKADPRLAMSEAEPSAIATGTGSKLAPLRAIQHRDANGNPIADPDRSNPTRSRWERPLDTIRSFEAAIDGNYSRKSMMMRTGSTDSVSVLSNRRSYYGGSNVGTVTPRYPPDGYYGGRGSSMRPDSYYNSMSRPESYYDNGNGGPSNGYQPSRARYGRTASEPMLNNIGSNTMYPPHGNHQSYETVTTASGSGSSGEPLGYSTDPSSNNSSMDRIQGDQYGQNFPPKPPMHSFGRANGAYQNNGVYHGQNSGPPPPPRKDMSRPPQVPIKLGNSNGGPSTYNAPVTEKRKSWFGRRFSKS